MEEERRSRSRYMHLIWFLPSVFLVSYWLVLAGPHQSEAVYWSSEDEAPYASAILTIRIMSNAASFLLTPVGLILVSFRRTRCVSLFFLLGVLMFWGGKITSFACNGSQPSPREKALMRLNERFAPVVQAIGRFRDDKGRCPRSLQELTPAYLKEIPPTGLHAFPTCDYLEGEKAKAYGGNPWVLVLDNPWCSTKEEILYCPLQNYSTATPGESVRQIGRWAHIRGR